MAKLSHDDLIGSILSSLPNHKNGAPVFIEQDRKHTL